MGICLTTVHKGITILTLQVGRIYSLIRTVDIGLIIPLSRRLERQAQYPEAQEKGEE